jgi:hypothetical protein
VLKLTEQFDEVLGSFEELRGIDFIIFGDLNLAISKLQFFKECLAGWHNHSWGHDVRCK